nr:RNA-directed DNA polymerase, eukaryota, reverse transcriptase zinc-binding domain protein [Tanacetum cinerariifolium]
MSCLASINRDIVKSVSTAVHSGTAGVSSVAVTAAIVTVVSLYGPSRIHFLKASPFVVEVVIGVVMINDLLNYEVKMICRILSRIRIWNVRGMCTSDKQKEVTKFISKERLQDICSNLVSFVSFVYAANGSIERKDLWADLRVSFISNEMQEFKDCINMIEVEDLCIAGMFFTWTKNLKKAREGDGSGVLKKLVRVMVIEEFMKKYDSAHDINDYGTIFSNKNSDDEALVMVKDVTSKEIKDALFDIGDNKAPGPDGYSSVLFKKAWKVIELLKWYDRKGGPKRVALKIDIQKAYDIVNWCFLESILTHFAFLGKMINWIMMNVKRSPKFQYHYGCRSMKITHVCFANDLLVLCHGDPVSVKVVRDSIDEFSECFGLLPNYSKNTIFFGSVSEEIQEDIMRFMPFEKRKLSMKYLGVTLITKRLGIKNCKCLVIKLAPGSRDGRTNVYYIQDDYNLLLLSWNLYKSIGLLFSCFQKLL